MDLPTAIAEITAWSVDERLQVVESVWDSIAAEPELLELTEAQEGELGRRLAAHEANPDEVVPWEAVKAEALARLGR